MSVGLVAINLDTVPAVQAPIITMVQRTSDNEVVVAFNPQFQDGVFDVSYYIANNVSLPDLVSYILLCLRTCAVSTSYSCSSVAFT